MENFDRENIDELLEICQIRQYFTGQNFVPYGILLLQYVLPIPKLVALFTAVHYGAEQAIEPCSGVNGASPQPIFVAIFSTSAMAIYTPAIS